MTGIVLAGLLIQGVLMLFSRTAAVFPGAFASLVLMLISAGKMSRGFPLEFLGMEVPAWAALLVGLAWFGFSVWCLFRLEKAFIPATFKGLVLGLGKAALLFSIVIVLMAVIVFPMVLLATSLPGIFSGLVLGGGLVLMVWILVRKYRTMIRLDIADTRVRSREDWPSLGLRWLFHTAVRPFLILAALVAYVYGLALFGVAPFFGGLILVVLTLACMWLTKAVRALPWMGGSE